MTFSGFCSRRKSRNQRSTPTMNRSLWSVEENGFLPCRNPLQRLSHPQFQIFESFVDVLPAKIAGGRVKDEINKLPNLTVPELSRIIDNEDELERAVLVYSFIAHAYLNGDKGGKEHQGLTGTLPSHIAVPWKWLSDQVGRPPILTYASCTLYNWKVINPEEEVSLDNITILGRFLGIVDEEWFFKIHVMIEYHGGSVVWGMKEIMRIIEDVEDPVKDHRALLQISKLLSTMIEALQKMNLVLKQLFKSCDPYIFFSSLRVFLSSYKDGKGRPEGLVFEGVAEFEGKPQNFVGASGAQSSILPCLDAFLGIKYDNNPVLDRIVHGMLAYMPRQHREFCKSVDTGILREYITKSEPVERGFSELRQKYDQIIDEVVKFRKEHLSYAAKYIVNEVERRNGPMVLGTGGTPFMKYLTMHLKTTKRMQFKFKYTPTGYIRGTIRNVMAHLPESIRGHDSRIIAAEPQILRLRRRKMIFKGLLGFLVIFMIYFFVISKE
eukprot:TRINITY_DN4633_c0_g1_i1.p1 TRINITY_DN4633_c0_g1~~TRINITY_DN4633_c0_g1_i1.p1  ORF type:complete len:494 (+),score=43.27 TRINITY_DN4633_c0_g1_i1:438-1919(+)